MAQKKTLALIIMDGWGDNPVKEFNAVANAKTPVLDGLCAKYAHTDISASGIDVGLPDGQMGNSEVGHTNIGAGRIVYQELTRVTKAIADGDFFDNNRRRRRRFPLLVPAGGHERTENGSGKSGKGKR